jgi:crossover junction endodeoxyribonuclease RuvC
VIALGIDPGTRHLGWGVVTRDGNRLRHVAHGVIDLDTKQPLAQRLVELERKLELVIQRYRPAVGSVETLFFHKDAQAAAKLGHARGVVLLSLSRAGVAVAEYAPARVKRTIAGRGQAEKHQVAMMIRALLSLDQLPRADAADALALAVTHLRAAPVLEALARRAAQTGATPLHALLRGRSRGRGLGRRRNPRAS